MAENLPPWLTRQYDLAGGIRGIGRGYMAGTERNAMEQQMTQRQMLMQAAQEKAVEAAKVRAVRQQGVQSYQNDLQSFMQANPNADPRDAAVKAYVKNAHLIDPIGFGKTLNAPENEYLRERGQNLKKEADELAWKTKAKIVADTLDAKGKQFEKHAEDVRGMFDARMDFNREKLDETAMHNQVKEAQDQNKPSKLPRSSVKEIDSIYKEIDRIQKAHDEIKPEGSFEIDPKEPGQTATYKSGQLPNTVKRMQLSTQIAKLKERARAIETGTKADTAKPDTAPADSGKVRVIKPDGSTGFLPASRLDDALKAGWKKAE